LNLPIVLPISPVMENEPQLPSGASALEIAVLESPTTPPAALLMREYGFILKFFPLF